MDMKLIKLYIGFPTSFNIGIMVLLLCTVVGCNLKKESSASNETIQFTGRSKVRALENWKTESNKMAWKTKETAIIICDMWDEHWCKGMTAKVAEMAPKINELSSAARKNGITVIHAPSDNMDYYEGTPERNRLKNVQIELWAKDIPAWYHMDPLKETELPIDDSDDGCDDFPKCKNRKVWSRQINTITIDEKDGISDSGSEILSYFHQNEIKNVIMTGVATNMCVLGRSFGIRSLINAGLNVILIRDLTDIMYNHEMPPYVDHDIGTQLMVEHIEKYWCPSVLSEELLQNWN
jgi:nicotinamidase-related amidase